MSPPLRVNALCVRITWEEKGNGKTGTTNKERHGLVQLLLTGDYTNNWEQAGPGKGNLWRGRSVGKMLSGLRLVPVLAI